MVSVENDMMYPQHLLGLKAPTTERKNSASGPKSAPFLFPSVDERESHHMICHGMPEVDYSAEYHAHVIVKRTHKALLFGNNLNHYQMKKRGLPYLLCTYSK